LLKPLKDVFLSTIFIIYYCTPDMNWTYFTPIYVAFCLLFGKAFTNDSFYEWHSPTIDVLLHLIVVSIVLVDVMTFKNSFYRVVALNSIIANNLIVFYVIVIQQWMKCGNTAIAPKLTNDTVFIAQAIPRDLFSQSFIYLRQLAARYSSNN
jgi:hypothetical protein